MRIPLKIALYIAAVLVALVACEEQRPMCTLHFTLHNAAGDTLYIMGTQHGVDALTTLVLDDEGTAQHVLPIDTVLPLTVLLPDAQMITFYAERDVQVYVQGDIQVPDSIQIVGGETNAELMEARELLLAAPDSAARYAVVDTFILRHPFSPVSAQLLETYYVQRPTPDIRKITTLMESMSGMLQDHPLVARMLTAVDYAAKADTGRFITNFRVQGYGGEVHNSAYYKGKCMVVSFWASWDKRSVALERQLREVREKTSADDVAFVSVCLDMDIARWERNIATDTINVEHMCDGEGWASTLTRQFDVAMLPTVVVLTSRQKVALRATDIKSIERSIKQQAKAVEEERRQKAEREAQREAAAKPVKHTKNTPITNGANGNKPKVQSTTTNKTSGNKGEKASKTTNTTAPKSSGAKTSGTKNKNSATQPTPTEAKTDTPSE